MAKAVRAVGDAATNAHRAMKELADPVGTFMVDAFQLLALFVIGATTVWSAAAMFLDMAAARPRPDRGHPSPVHLSGNRRDGRHLLQDHAPSGSLSDLHCHDGSRPSPDRNWRRGTSNGVGPCGGGRRNPDSVVRRVGSEVRSLQISVRCVGWGAGLYLARTYGKFDL